MQNRMSSLRLLFIFLLAAAGPRAEVELLAQETKTIWVAHRRVDCIGVAPQKCYLIKDHQYEDWRFWYGEIAGFDYEEGFAYEIEVIEHRVENPPADASAIELELVEVLIKVETDAGVVPSAPAAGPAPESAPAPTPDPVPTPAPTTPAPTDSPVLAAPSDPPALPEPVAAPPDPADTPPPRSQARGDEHRGHLTIGTGIETRSFKLCGAEESVWIEDRTAGDLWATYRELANYSNRPIFMVVRGRLTEAPHTGFGVHYSQQLLVDELRHAAAESAGCFDDPDDYAYRATGNEPFWNLTVSRRGLVLTRMGEEGRTLFPYSPPTFLDRQVIYRSQTGGNAPKTLVVRLEEIGCRDTMADADFSFRATIEIDDQVLAGCAVEGGAEP